MNKKILIGVAAVIIVAVAYWLLSPLWRNTSLYEELPGITNNQPVDDSLSHLNKDSRAEFEKQTNEMRDKMLRENEGSPAGGSPVMSRSNMIAKAHEVKGEALFIKSGNETYLRFENLKTINGPDLRIYLSADLAAKDFVDLGPIRATEGNVNYLIPNGTDISKYKNAMIWCRTFGVLFSYAEL